MLAPFSFAGSGFEFTVSQALVSPPAVFHDSFSLHCDDVLLIEALVGLACERVHSASWSPSICHRVRSGHEALWLSCLARCARGIWEVLHTRKGVSCGLIRRSSPLGN